MKGIIIKCWGEFVTARFGKEKWEEIMESSGYSKYKIFVASEDMDDAKVEKGFLASSKILDISFKETVDLYGDYFINTYTQKLYPQFYRKNDTLKEALSDINDHHEKVSQMLGGARPPRLTCEWSDENKVTLHYKSHRNMFNFMLGILRGLCKYYNENPTIKIIGQDTVEIVFQK